MQYTFWSARAGLRATNKGWRLDYFLISKDQIDKPRNIKLVDSTIMDSQEGSDHCPIGLQIKLLKEPAPVAKHVDMEESKSVDKAGKKNAAKKMQPQRSKTPVKA